MTTRATRLPALSLVLSLTLALALFALPSAPARAEREPMKLGDVTFTVKPANCNLSYIGTWSAGMLELSCSGKEAVTFEEFEKNHDELARPENQSWIKLEFRVLDDEVKYKDCVLEFAERHNCDGPGAVFKMNPWPGDVEMTCPDPEASGAKIWVKAGERASPGKAKQFRWAMYAPTDGKIVNDMLKTFLP